MELTVGRLLRNAQGDWAFEADFQSCMDSGYVWPLVMGPPRWSIDLHSFGELSTPVLPFEHALCGIGGAVAIHREGRLYLVGYIDVRAPGVQWEAA